MASIVAKPKSRRRGGGTGREDLLSGYRSESEIRRKVKKIELLKTG